MIETDYLLLGKADTDTPEYLDEKLPETFRQKVSAQTEFERQTGSRQ